MKHPQRITIETSPQPDGGYRAQIAEGPSWTRGFATEAGDADGAYKALRTLLWLAYPKADVDFMHAPSTREALCES